MCMCHVGVMFKSVSPDFSHVQSKAKGTFATTSKEQCSVPHVPTNGEPLLETIWLRIQPWGTLLSTALIPQNFTDSTRMRVTVLKQKVLLPSATFIPGFHSLGSQPGFGRLQALPWHSSSLSLMIHWFKTIHWIYINWQCHFHDGAALSGQLSQSRVLLWWVNTGLHPRHVLIGFREPPCHQQHGVGHRAYKGTVATS